MSYSQQEADLLRDNTALRAQVAKLTQERDEARRELASERETADQLARDAVDLRKDNLIKHLAFVERGEEVSRLRAALSKYVPCKACRLHGYVQCSGCADTMRMIAPTTEPGEGKP